MAVRTALRLFATTASLAVLCGGGAGAASSPAAASPPAPPADALHRWMVKLHARETPQRLEEISASILGGCSSSPPSLEEGCRPLPAGDAAAGPTPPRRSDYLLLLCTFGAAQLFGGAGAGSSGSANAGGGGSSSSSAPRWFDTCASFKKFASAASANEAPPAAISSHLPCSAVAYFGEDRRVAAPAMVLGGAPASAGCRSGNASTAASRALQGLGLQQGGFGGGAGPRGAVDVLRTLKVDKVFWGEGVRGKGAKVAIFDTGIAQKHPHFRSADIALCADYTDGKAECEDGFGHGTFVAGLIASQQDCLGLAPDASLYIFKVFTDQQVSYTSWFVDAFNHAIDLGVDVLNLSIGGPDYMDRPFTDKVREAVSNGITIISAIGNDGPTYGTVNNPADMLEVIGVGAATRSRRIAPFSSRGMTTWELPQGYGRAKPDLVTYGEDLRSSLPSGGCTELSGTSVASPVVAGVAAELVSYLKHLGLPVNPGLVKKILVASSKLLPKTSVYEQGAGLLSSPDIVRFVKEFTLKGGPSPPYELYRPAFLPESLPLHDCEVFAPLCKHPVFHTAMPLTVNLTVINPAALVGKIVSVKWNLGDVQFASGPERPDPQSGAHSSRNRHHRPHRRGGGGVGEPHPGVSSPASPEEQAFFAESLVLAAEYPDVIHPYFGWLAISVTLSEDVAHLLKNRAGGSGSGNPPDPKSSSYLIEGTLTAFLEVTSTPSGDDIAPKAGKRRGGGGEGWPTRHEFSCSVSFRVIPRPKRDVRVLWDVFHNMQYPPAYVARDDLVRRTDVLDWNGDHPHTNYIDTFYAMVDMGYHVDLLGDSFTSFDAAFYKVLFISDPEEEFAEDEKVKLKHDVLRKGLAVLIFADWYNQKLMDDANFVDENTRELWGPVVGGSNIPALNDLLDPYDIALSSSVWEGTARISPTLDVAFKSGASLLKFPSGGQVFFSETPLNDLVQSAHLHGGKRGKRRQAPKVMVRHVPILGLTDYQSGVRIGVFGDSGCIDSSHLNGKHCTGLLEALLAWGCSGVYHESLKTSPSIASHQDARLSGETWSDPLGSRPKRTAAIQQLSHALHGEGDRRASRRAPHPVSGAASRRMRNPARAGGGGGGGGGASDSVRIIEDGGGGGAASVPLKRRRSGKNLGKASGGGGGGGGGDAVSFGERQVSGGGGGGSGTPPLSFVSASDDPVVTVPPSHTAILLYYYKWCVVAGLVGLAVFIRCIYPKGRRRRWRGARSPLP